MQPESSQVPDNESQLLQSTINPDDRPIGATNPSSSGFDQVPVGGSKFQFSQFPEDGQMPKPTKKVTKTLKPKKPVIKKTPGEQTTDKPEDKQNDSLQKPAPLDQIPVGKASNIDEKPVGKSNPVQQRPIGAPSVIDQQPIGGGKSSAFMMSEYPQGEEPQEATQTVYPMAQKLKSKAVKLRLSGMEDVLALLTDDPQSPDLAEVQIAKLMKETNPACLEKILQCFKAWIEKGRQWGEDEAKAAIENGYVNGKPNTKKLTIEICDVMYEQKEGMLERTILLGLKGKVAKSIQGYVTIIIELLAIYGIKKMKFLKPYMPQIMRILNNEKNPGVKTQCMSLVKEAYKWMSKAAVDPFLADLKENFKKQLDTFWEGYDQDAVMTAPKDIPIAADGGNGKANNKKIDAYQISDAVDIFKKFNQKWSESVLKAQKWNEKVRLMQELVAGANVPKIAATDYRHITEMIKRLINDSNFNVVLTDLKIIGALSKGLRRPFYPFVKSIFSNILSKFRDKKTQMVDETFNTLNDLNYCLSIEDVIDDVKEGLGDKAPNMKVNLINWIGKFVERKIDEKGELTDKTQDALKSLFPIFEKLLSDGTADVRNCMVSNIAKMKMLIGDNFFDKVENKMNKNQVSKVVDVKESTKPKANQSREKDKPLQKDLSKSRLSATGKEANSRMSRTMNASSKNFEEEDASQRRSFAEVGGKVDLTREIENLLPKMNDQKYWEKRKEAAETLIGYIEEYSDKIVINNTHDLLATLKAHINDTNKQLIKIFVHLTGLVFGVIPERDAKANAKNFACQLAESLSDKNEQNKKQTIFALNCIGDAIGKDFLLAMMAPYLEGHGEARLEVINLILMNEDSLTKACSKEYPKGIISCLCDKNTHIRAAAEKLLERVIDITGFDVFRTLANQQRPAFTKDLNATLDRLEKGGNMNSSALLSKGVSPIRPMDKKNLPTSASARKNQKSLSKINKSFERESEVHHHHEEVLAGITRSRNLVEGDQFFAPLKVLTAERIDRQQAEERTPWRTDDITEEQEETFREQITSLIRIDVANKMMSFDYRRVLVGLLQIVKVCKDINQQGHIREMYDLILKWVLMRLWGGNPSLLSIIEVLAPVMSILEKKKLILTDNDVEIIIAIIREYFISAFMSDSKVSENLYTIVKCMVVLSSGDRVLRKMLKQFTIELSGLHRHLRKEANLFYRDGLAKLIKNQMMEYMGNEDALEEASRIKELRNDPQFLDNLYRTFHENILNSFGFRPPGEIEQQRPSERPSMRAATMQAPSEHKMPTNAGSFKNIHQNNKGQDSRTQQRDHSASRRASNSRLTPNPVKQREEPPEDFDLSSYPAPHPSSPLGKNLAKLLPPNEQTNNFFTALFVENGEKIANELVTHAKVIFGSILRSVIQMLERRTEFLPQKIVTQINLLQQAIKCRNIVRNIGDLLYYVTNFALNQLVYEDENKALIYDDLRARGIDYRVDNFIKVINGVMLRILENAAPQEVTIILFDLLNRHQAENQSNKTIYLIIKCITRVSTSYGNDCRPDHVREYLLRVNEYIYLVDLQFPLQEFNPPNEKLKPEQNMLKSIKNTLEDLCRLYKNGVWALYDKAMGDARFPDNHIASFISAQGIPYPEKGRPTQNDEMKKINELLSKNKTFDSGVEKLKKYVEANNDFSPLEYFTNLNYDHKFINMVMNALEDGHNQRLAVSGTNFATGHSHRKTPTRTDTREDHSANRRDMPSSEGNIQEKIRKLKMKFEELQPKEQEKPAVGSRRANQQDHNEQRALQIKRRIDEMKNRMTGTYQRQPR